MSNGMNMIEAIGGEGEGMERERGGGRSKKGRTLTPVSILQYSLIYLSFCSSLERSILCRLSLPFNRVLDQ